MFNQKVISMRKITLFSLLILMSSVIFAQSLVVPNRTELRPTKKANDPMEIQKKPTFRSLTAFGDTIWTNDFSNPDEWVITNETGDEQNWEILTYATQTPLYGIDTIISTTVDNGYACFNSDYMGTVYGGGSALPGQHAFLTIVDPIDMTTNSAVQFNCEQLYRKWEDTVYLEVSTDGVNFTSFLVNDVDGGINVEADLKVNITSAAANQPAVWFRFRFHGNWDYAWFVDDIAIFEAPDNNMAINVANAPFIYINTGLVPMVPRDHAWWYRPGAEIQNFGNLDQNNISLNCQIVDGIGQTVYDWTTDSIGVWEAETWDTIWMDSVFMPYLIAADYTATFTATQDEADQVLDDNTMSVDFHVTDTVWANDNDVVTGGISPWSYSGTNDGDAIGANYALQTDDTLGSVSCYIHSATSTGAIIKAEVYRHDETLDDYMLVIDSEEHIITDEDKGEWVTLDLTSEDGLQQYVTADTYYAMISCFWGSDTILIGNDKSNPDVTAYNFQTSLRIGSEWYYTSHTPMVRLNMRRTVEVLNPLQAAISESGNVSCTGDNDGYASVGISGGDEENYDILWSTGDTTEMVTGLAGGDYAVTVTDHFTDTIELSVTIEEAAELLAVAAEMLDETCEGEDGEIELTVTGGAEPYMYEWSNGEATAMVTGLTAGTYGATVTDAYGCVMSDDELTIENPYPMEAVFTITDVSAEGAADGEIATVVTGGVEPYTYAWDNAATTADITGLDGGYYNVTITDDNGCTLTDNLYVYEDITADCSGFSIDATITDVSCNGGDDATATGVATGGTAPFAYSWSNGQTVETATDLMAGTYTLIMVDDSLCSDTIDVIITEPDALTITDTVFTLPTTAGGSDGSIEITVAGGTVAGDYTYSWENGSTEATATGLAAGYYDFTITDDNGCELIDSIEMPDFSCILEITLTGTNVSCNGNTDGAVSVTATGANGALTYSWIGPDSYTSTDESISGLEGGVYAVTVADAAGCTDFANVTLTTPNAISVSYTQSGPWPDADGAINTTVIGGTSPYTYLWSDNTTLDSLVISSDDVGTEVSVVITDDAGCTETLDITIGDNVSELVIPTIEIYPNPSTGILHFGNINGEEIEIYNVLGEKVRTFTTNKANYTIDLSNQPSGMYMVKVNGEGVEKVVISR
jgi:hypothetical protein